MDDTTNNIVKSESIEKTKDVYSKENKNNAGLISAVKSEFSQLHGQN